VQPSLPQNGFALPFTDRSIRSSTDAVFPTHNDHRMAMSLAPLALVLGSITLAEPHVVSKSYPHFWDDLTKAGFGVRFVRSLPQ
jgi:3-phosphoshikimate 1-carboxyvinyltransferase